MLCAADGPDEVDLLGGGFARVDEVEQVADGEEVVGDACAGGEEDGGPVACGVCWVRSVGAFDVSGCAEDAGWRGKSAVVQFAGHALARGHNEGQFCGFLGWWKVILDLEGGLLFQHGRG